MWFYYLLVTHVHFLFIIIIVSRLGYEYSVHMATATQQLSHTLTVCVYILLPKDLVWASLLDLSECWVIQLAAHFRVYSLIDTLNNYR